MVYSPILNAGLKVMWALGAAHAVTSCAQEVTVSTATIEVEALALVYTATWIELWFASPWVAATPGVGNKVRKMMSSWHGILTPVNLSNALASPNAHAVLTTNDMLIKDTVMKYRSSQQKESGGGGGGGGMFEWYTGVVGVVHVRASWVT